MSFEVPNVEQRKECCKPAHRAHRVSVLGAESIVCTEVYSTSCSGVLRSQPVQRHDWPRFLIRSVPFRFASTFVRRTSGVIGVHFSGRANFVDHSKVLQSD